MSKSLNKVQLIGNVTRDPELKYTPSGRAVCTFGLATNRTWTTETGEKHDEADFHNIVAWGKLAEICSQLLVKGRKTYVEGRLATRSWTTPEGQQRNRTEVVIEEMIVLDSKGQAGSSSTPSDTSDEQTEEVKPVKKIAKKETVEETVAEPAPVPSEEEVAPEDIPF